MVIKLYISGISGNKEVKKKQQRVQMILDSKQINYEAIDITEPGKEKDKEFMQQNGKVRESLGKYPLPPQIFNDDDFCGDYEDFDMANEVDELEKFLHIETSSKDINNETKQTEECDNLSNKSGVRENSSKSLSYDPFEFHTIKLKWDSINGVQEEVVSLNTFAGENVSEVEENKKSEVNGESEVISTSDLITENVTKEKSETLTEEVPVQNKEESEENVEEKVQDVEEVEKNVEEIDAERGPHSEESETGKNVNNESGEKEESEKQDIGDSVDIKVESDEKVDKEEEEEKVAEEEEKKEEEKEEEENERDEKEEEGDKNEEEGDEDEESE